MTGSPPGFALDDGFCGFWGRATGANRRPLRGCALVERADHRAHAVPAQGLRVDVDPQVAAVRHLGAGAGGGVADPGGAGGRLAEVDHRVAGGAGVLPGAELIVDRELAGVDLGEVDGDPVGHDLGPAGAAVGHVDVAAAGHALLAGVQAVLLGGRDVGGVGVVVDPLPAVRMVDGAVVVADLPLRVRLGDALVGPAAVCGGDAVHARVVHA